MIHLAREISVHVVGQEKYDFNEAVARKVVGTTTITVTEKPENAAPFKKQVDAFIVPNDKGLLRSVFVTICRLAVN